MRPTEAATSEAEEVECLDILVPDGCPLCDGPMHLRIRTDSACALCKRCEYFAEPDVTPSAPGRYELMFVPTVEV